MSTTAKQIDPRMYKGILGCTRVSWDIQGYPGMHKGIYIELTSQTNWDSKGVINIGLYWPKLME